MTATLDTIADAFPMLETELYGLTYSAPSGHRVIVSDDGAGEFLVALYGPQDYERGERELEGVIIPADATEAEVLATIREYIEATGVVIEGRAYSAMTTGTNRGQRTYRPIHFIAARTMAPEPFIRGQGTTPDQDRIFRTYEDFGAVPILIVTGTLRQAEAGA